MAAGDRADRIRQGEQDEPEGQSHAGVSDFFYPVDRGADRKEHEDECAHELGHETARHDLPPLGVSGFTPNIIGGVPPSAVLTVIPISWSRHRIA